MSQALTHDFEALRNADVRTVDLASLTDIQEVKIDPNKPLPERMRDFISQIKNPYCFRYGNIAVKISYADTETTLAERMEGFFRLQ